MLQSRHTFPGILLFGLLALALPFMSVSCNSQKIATFSGYEVAFGAAIPRVPTVGSSANRLPSQPLILTTFLLSVLACGIGFAMHRAPKLLLAGLSGLSFLLLILFKIVVGEQATQQMNMLTVDMEMGFWLQLLANLAAAVVAVLAPKGRGEQLPLPPPPPPLRF